MIFSGKMLRRRAWIAITALAFLSFNLADLSAKPRKARHHRTRSNMKVKKPKVHK